MAYSVRQERQGLAVNLRDQLSQAERDIVQVRRDGVEAFLRLLDSIDDHFRQLADSGLDLRPEQTRWTSLQSKLEREAGRIVRAADAAGGLARLRQDNPQADGFWWHLDDIVAARRRRLIQRLATTVGALALIVVGVWVLLTYVFPPDPNTVIASEATSILQQMAFEGRWEDALAIIDEAKAKLTEPDAELLLWEGVIAGIVGQTERSQEALAAARDLVPDSQETAYWWTLGSIYLAVGDLENARNAGNQSLAVDENDPQGYFLLASVAEAEGDNLGAIDLFEKTFELAADNNPQLAVIARVRMGNLLQLPPGPAPGTVEGQEEETEGSTEGTQGN